MTCVKVKTSSFFQPVNMVNMLISKKKKKKKGIEIDCCRSRDHVHEQRAVWKLDTLVRPHVIGYYSCY